MTQIILLEMIKGQIFDLVIKDNVYHIGGCMFEILIEVIYECNN
jgi:hypothetical protein